MDDVLAFPSPAAGALRFTPPHTLVTALLTSTAASLPLDASAWGSEGHRLIAEVVET